MKVRKAAIGAVLALAAASALIISARRLGLEHRRIRSSRASSPTSVASTTRASTSSRSRAARAAPGRRREHVAGSSRGRPPTTSRTSRGSSGTERTSRSRPASFWRMALATVAKRFPNVEVRHRRLLGEGTPVRDAEREGAVQERRRAHLRDEPEQLHDRLPRRAHGEAGRRGHDQCCRRHLAPDGHDLHRRVSRRCVEMRTPGRRRSSTIRRSSSTRRSARSSRRTRSLPARRWCSRSRATAVSARSTSPRRRGSGESAWTTTSRSWAGTS